MSDTPYDEAIYEKYKFSASIVNSVLSKLVGKSNPGASVKTLCQWADDEITKQCSSVFKKSKDMKKGVAFPTSISVNNCVCHFSPLPSDPDVILKQNDIVKIDVSGHVDGYISSVATSFAVGASKTKKAQGRSADVLLAGHTALQYAIRMLMPGKTNHQITDGVCQIAKSFDCCSIEGMLSHQMQKDEMFSTKVIMMNPTESMKKEYKVTEFEAFEVYAIEIFVSTSREGRCQEKDAKPTIFRRNPTALYDLRVGLSREVLHHITSNFPKMSFHLRSLPNLNRARLGLKECLEHQLVTAYPVYFDREKELTVQMKATVIVTPEGPLVISAPLFDPETVTSDKIIVDPAILKVLKAQLNVKKIKRDKIETSNDGKSVSA